MGSSDSESEDERRVVRSAKDKAHDELRATCNDIKARQSRGCFAEQMAAAAAGRRGGSGATRSRGGSAPPDRRRTGR